MPNTTSAQKSLRQNKKRHQHNLKRKKRMKGVIKTYKDFIKDEENKKAQKQLSEVYKVLDKLTKVNYIKKGKATRMKSRLAKKLNKK